MIFRRIKLWRMLRALGLRLPKQQKKIILSKERPKGLGLWERRSGKTVVSELWMFMNLEGNISLRNFGIKCPDPDMREWSGAWKEWRISQHILNWTYDDMFQKYKILREKGIKLGITMRHPTK